MRIPSFVLACFVPVVLVASQGCSSSGSGSDPGTGATDTGTGGGPQFNPNSVACYKAADKKCEIHGDDTQAGKDSDSASCTTEGGTVVTHCPSDGLVGCCLIIGLGECDYDAAAAASLQQACPAGGATWYTSAP